jgi:hypothetical protein
MWLRAEYRYDEDSRTPVSGSRGSMSRIPRRRATHAPSELRSQPRCVEENKCFARAHGTLIDDRFVGRGAAEIAAANA